MFLILRKTFFQLNVSCDFVQIFQIGPTVYFSLAPLLLMLRFLNSLEVPATIHWSSWFPRKYFIFFIPLTSAIIRFARIVALAYNACVAGRAH